MNKKFLSAILFGALMVTSTGTFVSCKDYDDDIDAINKELTDIKSQIAALQSKVDAGNYVTNITKAENGINVAFSNGTTTFVETAAKVEVEKNETATIVDGEWVITKADGTVVPTGVPASGVLVAGSQTAGYKLTVVNAAGEITEISLPTAASTLTSVEIVSGLTFGGSVTGASADEIQWGFGNADADWKGPKGAIAKNQLLVGDIAPAQIDITPATADLSSATITLVNSLGEVAPVTIVATPNKTKAANLITAPGSSRAASTDGKWNLKLSLTNAVNKDNAASAFMKDGNYVLYALCVNGTPYTAYDIAIKMASSKNTLTYAASDFYFQGNNDAAGVKGGSDKIDLTAQLGTTTIDVTGDYVIYDSYLVLADKDQAERYGVTVNGMEITAPNAAAQKYVDVVVKIKTVNNQTVSQKAKVTFGTIAVSEGTIETQSFKLMPNKMDAVFSVGELFSGLTAEEADKVANNYENGSVTWGADDKFYAKAGFGSYITYHKTAACNNDDKVTLTASTIRSIKYIKIASAAIKANTLASEITVKLSDNAGNEIKKAKMAVSFTLPTFEELFTKSGAWDGNTLSLKLDNNARVNFMSAFGSHAESVELANLNVPQAKNADGDAYFTYDPATNIMVAAEPSIVKGAAVEFTIKPTYHLIAGKDDTKITAAEAATVNFLAPISGMAIYNVEAGAAKNPVIKGTSGTIAKYNAAAKAEDQKGLYLEINGAKIAAELNATLYKAGTIANDQTLSLKADNTTITLDAVAGESAKAEFTSEGLKLTGLASGNYNTVVTIKVLDRNGIVTATTLTVTVEK